MSSYLFLSLISLGQYIQKSLAKSMRLRKYTKRRTSIKGAGLSVERGFKTSAHYDIGRLTRDTLEP